MNPLEDEKLLLEMQIEILQHKNNTLYKLCRHLEKYINENSLDDRKIVIKNQNGLAIESLSQLQEITYLEIPNKVFIINDKKE